MPGAGYLLGGINIPQDAINELRAGVTLALIAGITGPEVINDITGGKIGGSALPAEIAASIGDIVGTAEAAIGTPLFDILITSAAGLESADFSGQAAEATQMVKRMLGFGAALPLVIGELDAGIRALLGDHAPVELLDGIKRLPEEIGVNFFIGTVLERIFDVAVSQPLEEAIAVVKRPARLQGMELRALLRTKTIDLATATTLLQRAGYREEDIPLFLSLDRQLLPVGDLQTAYLDGILDEAGVRSKLADLGFIPEDIDLIVSIYLVKAQTEAGSQYRSIARAAFLSNDISEGQFRAILAQINVPKASIDLEVAALDLEKEIGKRHLSTADVKKAYQEGTMDIGQVRAQLSAEGYADDDITTLLALWDAEGKAGKQKVATNRILSYLTSGVLSTSDAYSQLLASGMTPDDARFLVEHPGANGTVYAHSLTQNTIISAFKDSVITIDTANALLKQIGVDPAEATLTLEVAAKQAAKSGKPKQPSKVLDVAEVKAAFELDLATLLWCKRELETIGYSEADADLITASWYAKANGKPPDGWIPLT